MELASLKVWHWAIIGVLAGALFAFVFSSVEWGKTDQSATSADFQRQLLDVERRANNAPVIQDIVIFPERDGERIVRYSAMMRIQGKPEAEMTSRYFRAKSPYQVAYAHKTPYNLKSSAPDVMTYLAAVQTANPTFTYTYQWWLETKVWYPLCMGAGLVLIGGIWPIIIRLMIGTGLAPKPQESEYDKRWRDHKPSSEPMPVLAVNGPTDADAQQLEELNSTLEKSIAAGGMALTAAKTPDQAEEKKSDAAIRKLVETPLEQPKAPLNPEEPKDFRGEFYPVARPHEKKDEKKK